VHCECMFFCAQMHSRLESEMNDAKQQMDKEYETLKANADAQLKAAEQRHERDREALRRTGAAEEGKMQRSLQPKHDAEMRQQQAHLKKEYARIKETFKKVIYRTVMILLFASSFDRNMLTAICCSILCGGTVQLIAVYSDQGHK